MGQQLTTWLHRVASVPGTPFGDPAAATGAMGPIGAGDLRTAVAARVRALLAPAERDRVDAAVASARDLGGERAVVVLERTLAATQSVRAVLAMADVLAEDAGRRDARAGGDVGRAPGHGVSAARRSAGGAGDLLDAILEPVRWLGPAARQHDATTCGSAVLVMLAAQGDPVLALWLATGRLLDAAPPRELRAVPARTLAALGAASTEHRVVALQRLLKRRTNAGALLGLPWPHGLGTPPWGAARAARFLGLTFGHTALTDTDPVHLGAVLEQVARCVARGVPVPLYSGGDSSGGWACAVPRHVVLAVGPAAVGPSPAAGAGGRPSAPARAEGGLTVWEPSAGRLEHVTTAALLEGGRPLRALGGWSHLSWAVLPRL